MKKPNAHTSKLIIVTCAVGILLGGCTGGTTEHAYAATTGGDPDRGRKIIQRVGCGSCHTIPGVTGARGVVGPPLTRFGVRSYIAGVVPNTPENLVVWVKDPLEIAPNTAMPDLALSDEEARDVAAYLYTLD